MRIRVLELPTQPDGERNYRTPWVLVVDDIGLVEHQIAQEIKAVARDLGAEGAIVLGNRVALGNDQ